MPGSVMCDYLALFDPSQQWGFHFELSIRLPLITKTDFLFKHEQAVHKRGNTNENRFNIPGN